MIMMWMKKSVQIKVYLFLSELNKTSSLLWKAKVRVVIWSPLTSGSMTTWRWRTLTKVRGVRVRWPWAPRGEAPTTTAQWTTCHPTTRTEVRTQVLFKALINLNIWIIYVLFFMYCKNYKFALWLQNYNSTHVFDIPIIKLKFKSYSSHF